MSVSVHHPFMKRVVSKVRHYHTALGVRGVLLFAWAKISGRKPLSRIIVPGIRHPVLVRIGTTDVSVFRQVLQECQYDFALPASPRHIVDAGANIGLTAVFFANKYPKSEIIAIEPEESNFRILRENVKPYPNVHPVLGALWKRECELVLIDPDSGHHGFQTTDVGASTPRREARVQAFTVESLMKRMNWDRVDLLKVDIEGAEKEVFEACDSWISRVGACMVEVHDAIKPGCGVAFDNATASFSGRHTQGEALIAWRTSPA